MKCSLGCDVEMIVTENPARTQRAGWKQDSRGVGRVRGVEHSSTGWSMAGTAGAGWGRGGMDVSGEPDCIWVLFGLEVLHLGLFNLEHLGALWSRFRSI